MKDGHSTSTRATSLAQTNSTGNGIHAHYHILPSSQDLLFSSLSARISGIPAPEMLFINNNLRLEHKPSGTIISFNAVDALADVAERTPVDLVKVSYADAWSKG